MNDPYQKASRDTAVIVLIAVVATFACMGGLALILRPYAPQVVVAQPPLLPAATEYWQRGAEADPIPTAIPPDATPRPSVGEYEYELNGQFSGQVTALATVPPLVENGYEVVGPTSRKPPAPHPGQRYLDSTLNTYSIYNGTSWMAINTSAGVGLLDDVGDVAITGAAVGDFLGWNGTAWADLTISLDTLSDVAVTSPVVKQTIRHNGTTWVNSQLAVADLSDINFTSLADNDIQSYDLATTKWINESVYENQRIFSVTDYGATPDDATDDTAAIGLAVDAAEAYTALNAANVATVLFPRGTYIVQDASTAATLSGEAFGGVVVSSTAANIVLMGYDATLKIGTNGLSTAAVRLFGDRCRVHGLTVNANGDAAPLDTGTAGDLYDTKGNSGFEINGGEDCVIKDCKVYGDKVNTTYSTGTIFFDFTGGASERLVTISGGTLPGWVDAECAITISGVRYPIASVLSTTTLTLSANASNADNNPGGDVTAGTAYLVEGRATVGQGEECFVMVNAVRARFDTCLAMDAAWQAFRVSGDNNSVVHCSAYNHRGNGLRILNGDEVFIEDFKSYSTRNDGRHAIIADAGSSADGTELADNLDDSDVRTYRIYLKDCRLECNPDGDFDGAASVLKLASAYEAHVTNSTIIGGIATNNVGVRIEDSLRLATLEKCHIEPNIMFTPAGTSSGDTVYQGVISSHAGAGGDYAGYVRYTVDGGAGLEAGKTLFVRNSGIAQYDGPQIVLDKGSGFIITDRAYVAGSIGIATYCQSACDTFKLRDCVVVGMGLSPAGTGAAVFYNYFIENCIAYHVDIERCEFRMKERANIKMGGIFTDYDDPTAIDTFRLVRNKFEFNSDKLCRAVRGTAVSEMLASGTVTTYENQLSNLNTGVVRLNNIYASDDTTATYDERDILFSSDGDKPGLYAYTTYPVDATGVWLAGDYIRNSAPSAGEPSGWICTVAGSPGTWRALPNSQLLYANTTEAGNVGVGEDDLLSYTMPANTVINPGDTLEIEAGFSFAANANNKNVRFSVQGNPYYESTAVAQNGGSMVLRLQVTFDASVLSKYSFTTQTTASALIPSVAQAGGGLLTPGSAAIIKATGEATTTNDIVQEYMAVRLHRAP